MISGFLTSVISSLPTTPAYRGTPYVDYWFLPSSTPAFLSSEAFDKRTNRVSTDVADKHARYISEIATVRRSREGHEWISIQWRTSLRVDYCFWNALPLYLPRRYAIANARIALMPVPLPREWRPTGHVFLASSCLTPIRGFALFN